MLQQQRAKHSFERTTTFNTDGENIIPQMGIL